MAGGPWSASPGGSARADGSGGGSAVSAVAPSGTTSLGVVAGSGIVAGCGVGSGAGGGVVVGSGIVAGRGSDGAGSAGAPAVVGSKKNRCWQWVHSTYSASSSVRSWVANVSWQDGQTNARSMASHGPVPNKTYCHWSRPSRDWASGSVCPPVHSSIRHSGLTDARWPLTDGGAGSVVRYASTGP